MSDIYQTLGELVHQWHEAVESTGRDAVTTAGEGPQLILLLNRTRDGDLKLAVMSLKDLVGTLHHTDLLQPGTDLDEPVIPYASVLVPPK